MREWCVVLDARSSSSAQRIGDVLSSESLDVDVDTSAARVWCFADSERAAKDAQRRIRSVLRRESLWAGDHRQR